MRAYARPVSAPVTWDELPDVEIEDSRSRRCLRFAALGAATGEPRNTRCPVSPVRWPGEVRRPGVLPAVVHRRKRGGGSGRATGMAGRGRAGRAVAHECGQNTGSVKLTPSPGPTACRATR